MEKETAVGVKDVKLGDATLVVANEHALVPVDPDKVRQELGFVAPDELKADPADPELEAAANKFAQMLVSVDPKKDYDSAENAKASVENMGLKIQIEAAAKSDMLKRQVKALATKGDDGGPVAKGMVDLKMQVEELDPAKLDLEPGWFSRTIGNLPGIGTPLKRYFTQYESAQTVIDAIVRSLKLGAEQLQRDNVTITEDQRRSRGLTVRLEKAIKLAQLIDKKIAEKLDEPTIDPERSKFIQEEMVFPLRQRILDLQQTLAVHQEAVMVYEIIVRNNKELIRGVNRVINTTITALQVAVTAAFALNDQKIVLDKIEGVNTLTDNMILHTAERLKTQGVAIHKQASMAMLNIDNLKAAFTNINQAFTDISNFRRESLPMMAQSIIEMDRISAEAETTIKKMEKGNVSKSQIEIEY